MLPIFIALKQLVDVLYEYKVLQFLMVAFAVGIIGYRFVKDKWYQNFFQKTCMTDYLVVVLGILYLFSFLRYPEAKNQFIKTESIFLIYFLGRVLAKDEWKFTWQRLVLLITSYGVLYANFFYRLYSVIQWKRTGNELVVEYFGVQNGGALYYYKTDLAIGVIICIIMIYVFHEEKKLAWLKWISIFPVSLFLTFSGKARMGQAILFVEYLLILVMEIKKWRKKVANKDSSKASDIEHKSLAEKWVHGIFLAFAILLTGFFIFVQTFPPLANDYYGIGISAELDNKIENIFHSRHVIWWDIMHYFRQQPFFTRLTGIDLATESMHNQRGMRFHMQYLKIVYSIGYLGSYLFLGFFWKVCHSLVKQNPAITKEQQGSQEQISAEQEQKQVEAQEQNTKFNYLLISLGFMLLAMSFSAEAFEYTQMSWLPFLFSGILCSRGRATVS